MNDILFKILACVVYVLVFIFARYALPLIVTKVKESKYSFLAEAIYDAVCAYEQKVSGSGMGMIKKDQVSDYAIDFCHQHGIDVNPEQIDILIEAAVEAMKVDQKN